MTRKKNKGPSQDATAATTHSYTTTALEISNFAVTLPIDVPQILEDQQGISFDVTSDQVYTEKVVVTDRENNNTKTVRQDYFMSLLLQRPRYEHELVVGDLVVVPCPSQIGTPRDPKHVWTKIEGPWMLAQVAVIYVRHMALGQSLYFAQVRWLPLWKKQVRPRLSAADRKRHETNFRPDQAFVETPVMLVHLPVAKIMPIQVAHRNSKDFIDKTWIPPEVCLALEATDDGSDDDVSEINRVFCNGVFLWKNPDVSAPTKSSSPLQLESVRQDWVEYTKPPKERPQNPPAVLMRAWERLTNPALCNALRQEYLRNMDFSASKTSERSIHPHESVFRLTQKKTTKKSRRRKRGSSLEDQSSSQPTQSSSVQPKKSALRTTGSRDTTKDGPEARRPRISFAPTISEEQQFERSEPPHKLRRTTTSSRSQWSSHLGSRRVSIEEASHLRDDATNDSDFVKDSTLDDEKDVEESPPRSMTAVLGPSSRLQSRHVSHRESSHIHDDATTDSKNEQDRVSEEAKKPSPQPKAERSRTHQLPVFTPVDCDEAPTTSTCSLDGALGEVEDDNRSVVTTTANKRAVYTIPARKRKDGRPLAFFAAISCPTKHLLSHYKMPEKGKKGRKRKAYSPLPADTIMYVGDVVAVRQDIDANSLSCENEESLRFFKTAWTAGQILSIYSSAEPSSSSDQVVELQMEIRWLHRYDEFGPSVKATAPDHLIETWASSYIKVAEMDEYVSHVPVNWILGPVHVTSTIPPGRKSLSTPTLPGTSTPLPVLLCRDLCYTQYDDHFETISDWPMRNDRHLVDQEAETTDNDSWLAPLRRGLHCPRAMPAKDRKLMRAYCKALRKRWEWRGSLWLPVWESTNMLPEDLATSHATSSNYIRSGFHAVRWPLEKLQPTLDECPIMCQETNLIYKTSTRVYYTTLEVTLLKDRCDPRALAKKTETPQTWRLQMGQVVCVADNNAVVLREKLNNLKLQKYKNKNPHFPFIGPWSMYQILALYRTSDNNETTFHFEGRQLLRTHELPSEMHSHLPNFSFNSTMPLVWETDIVRSDLAVSSVLGIVQIQFGSLVAAPVESSDRSWAGDALTVVHQCRSFFHSSVPGWQPLFCSKPQPSVWQQMFLERGMRRSPSVQEDSILRNKTEFALNVNLVPLTNSNNASSLSSLQLLFQSMIAVSEISAKAPSPDPLDFHSGENAKPWFKAISVKPKWDKYFDSEIVCPLSDRQGRWWTLQMGDFVALTDRDTTGGASKVGFYPYTCPWKVGQVLALEQNPDMRAHVLVFHRVSYSKGVYAIHETTNIESVETARLLGPVYRLSDKLMEEFWDNAVPFLPVCFIAMQNQTGAKDQVHCSLASAKRGLLLSNEIDSNHQRNLLEAIASKLEEAKEDLVLDSVPESEVQSEHCDFRAPPSVAFHVDKASKKAYFKSIELRRPLSMYSPEVASALDSEKSTWKVLLGDIVVVHFDHLCAPVVYGKLDGQKRKDSFPFECKWAVAEVVCIFKDLEGEENMELEIRWLYRQQELPKRLQQPGAHPGERVSEEILESDHYDRIKPSALIAPVKVRSTPVPIWEPKIEQGMPILEFVCNQFWSIHRSTNIPCGSLESRIARGRLKSPLIKNDVLLQAALQKLEDHRVSAMSAAPEDINMTQNNDARWKECFLKVIQKLSLCDASKEGSDGDFAMIGRTHERNQINVFLRDSILGKHQKKKKFDRPTLFVAGPPGTGKTACVLSVIQALQRERGKFPPFTFVSLNGMEMRHPFEAYIRLWEKIDGSVKCSAEAAPRKLEAYFKDDDSEQPENVVVLLLDEIDYLVTKNQTVIYNFFDWPMRASRRRLVLIGISNTLNLPERLHARVQSRIGDRRCIFKAYTSEQISDILKAKIAHASPELAVFERDAITFASKKTGSFSGDLRKAFTLTREAAEFVLQHHEASPTTETPIVRIRDVVKVSRESFHSPYLRAVGHCTDFEALLLVALAALGKSTGRAQGGFDVEELIVKMEGIAHSLGEKRYLPPPSLHETIEMLQRLGETNLVTLNTPRHSSISFRATVAGSGGPWPLVALSLEDCDILTALKKTEHAELARRSLAFKL